MSDLWGNLDPQKLVLLAMLIIALIVLLFGCAIALIVWALTGLSRLTDAEFQSPDPDPFFEPGSHQGLRVGPARPLSWGNETAHARPSETSRPGTSQ